MISARNVTTQLTKISPVKFFIITAAFFGLLFAVITPPFQAPDEEVHFFRSYQISEFNFVTDRVNGVVGGVLPGALGKVITDTTTDPVVKFYPQNKTDIYDTIDAFKTPITGPQQVYDFSTTSLYGPVAYLPQATGIGISRLLNLPPLAMMYLGRLANLVAWIVLMAAAIRLMPIRKWVVVFIGLLPMALFQAASLSSDVVTFGLGCLFTGFVFYLLSLGTIFRYRHIAALVLLGTLLCLTKQPSFIFLGLVLLLPARNFFSGIKGWVIKLGVIVLPLLIMAVWISLTTGASAVANAGANGQDPGLQLSFILHNPHSYINTLWNTTFFTWGDEVTRSLIGTFGWADTPLSEWIVTTGYITLAFLLLVTTGKPKQLLNKYQKIFVWLLVLAYIMAVTTALYMFYSPIGYKIVYGLQGRYFIPVLILLIPLIYGQFATTTKRTYRKIAILGPLFLLISSIITIYVRFYVNNV